MRLALQILTVFRYADGEDFMGEKEFQI